MICSYCRVLWLASETETDIGCVQFTPSVMSNCLPFAHLDGQNSF